MGVLVGLGFGLGCLLVWAAFGWPRQPRVATAQQDGRLHRLLAEAGMREVAARSLVLVCVAVGFVVAVVVLGLTRTLPIAVVLGALGG